MHRSTLILIDQAKSLGNDVWETAAELLEDSRFDIWSGSSMKLIAIILILIALTGCKDDDKWNKHHKHSRNPHQMYY